MRYQQETLSTHGEQLMYEDDDYETCDTCSCCSAGRCNNRKGSDCGETCPCTND